MQRNAENGLFTKLSQKILRLFHNGCFNIINSFAEYFYNILPDVTGNNNKHNIISNCQFFIFRDFNQYFNNAGHSQPSMSYFAE